MKTTTILAAAVAVILGTSAATAGNLSEPTVSAPVLVPTSGLSYYAEAEYATKADVFSTEFGMNYTTGAFTATPSVTFDNATAGKFDYAEAGLRVAYQVNATTSLYVEATADRNFAHKETVLGARFDF